LKKIVFIIRNAPNTDLAGYPAYFKSCTGMYPVRPDTGYPAGFSVEYRYLKI
jgi:hypothetical protein